MSEQLPTLAYWRIRGLAEPARLLLRFGRVRFEDRQFEQGDAPDFCKACWFDVKEEQGLEFPNLPFYVEPESGLRLSQSSAILRHIARRVGVAGDPHDLVQQATIDMLLAQLDDLRARHVRLSYSPDFAEKRPAHVSEYLPHALGQLEAFLGKQQQSPWLLVELSTPDFVLYELVNQSLLLVPDCLAAFPLLAAHQRAFRALPPITEWLSSPDYEALPCNNKHARFK